MKITRRFTRAGEGPYANVAFSKRTSRITNPDGSVVFEMTDAEIPSDWSQLATDIMVSKYFRKAGVPLVGEDGKPLKDEQGKPVTGPEKSVKQVINRLVGCWRHWGETHGYFDTTEDAQAFYDELSYMLVHQMCAPNSPQWFNTGLNWAYGISGPSQGHFYCDPKTGELKKSEDAYTHPQPHACFIQSVSDDLVNSGGIMDLWVREARLFKYGSGTGSNFSNLRGENEPLSGGGKSSGLMSFLKIGDRAAGAIKSGGTTRRAAKMCCLNLDHPDIEEFVNWKVREEIKVAAMAEGIKLLPKDQQEVAKRLKLKLDYDFNGETYQTVSGQNSNNSVRIPNAFFKAVEENGEWVLRWRNPANKKPARTLKARELWDEIAFAAWRCADPGVQFDDTINQWHTCPQSGRINASNPCVTGDTLIATTTGYRRIVDLVGKSAEVIDGNGEAAFVEKIFKTGTKDVYQLRTRSGYSLRLTADHKVMTLNRGDVPACELTLDDMLMLEKPGFGDDFVPEAFGELLGAALGDGCLTRGAGEQEFLFISLGRAEAALAQQLQANLAECKQWLATGDGRKERDTNVVATATGVRVGTSVQAVLAKLDDYAQLACGSEGKALKDAIFGLDRRSIASVLRGLFTADGTVANYGEKSQYVGLDSVSAKLLEQVQLLLLGFGIKSKLYRNRRALGSELALLPDGKGGSREYPVQQMHSLRISRSSRVLFEREIGLMATSAKAAKLAELNREVATYREALSDRVESLTWSGVEDVYDLTEPTTHHFVANGIVVHNCSEYMFLDDTACNLASLNVLKFYDTDTHSFDIASYRHATRLWTIVLEVSVLMASFPSEEIARLSYEFRTLGLGYANLGAMLMQAGIPYNCDKARAICAALTSILTGECYATSAEMAKELGAFPGYAKNKADMLRVIRNHRRAAYNVTADELAKKSLGDYEKLDTRPVGIDPALFKTTEPLASPALLKAAQEAWDRALKMGEQFGYRNAQVSVIAPTGTIGLLMDCDTTGVEPDFALVKFKKLAGGGYFKIANQSLKPALVTLGYSAHEITDILKYVMGTLTLHDTPHINHGSLKALGLNKDDLARLDDAIPSVFELGFAFTPYTLGEEAMERLKVAKSQWQAPGFNLLRHLGFTAAQISEANDVACGRGTVEGAPHLKLEHYPVFECANRCGKYGKLFIPVEGHIRMMAAAQPFISGAISKTINLPNEAGVDDIKDAYHLSWSLGLKANALYRDGSKLSQPLNVKSDAELDKSEDDDEENVRAGKEEFAKDVAKAVVAAASAPGVVEKIVERVVERPLRRRLPDTRDAKTHKFDVAGHEGYITAGLYEDGTPGEVFITMAKEGSTIGGLMDTIATLVSVSLQYGVPVESLVRKFEHVRFEPSGMTRNRDIPMAKSLVDYIFRWLAMEFIPGYRDSHSPRRDHDEPKKDAPEPGRAAARTASTPKVTTGPVKVAAAVDPLSQQGASMQADAPACDVCGSITVRSGTCYKCLNCGNSMGCS
jgi:ribonucleoside-diphosphate reductase alpha chain